MDSIDQDTVHADLHPPRQTLNRAGQWRRPETPAVQNLRIVKLSTLSMTYIEATI